MKITEAIVLAGGLGTRLKSAVPDLPKCMAPVAQRPFISFVIDSLRMQGIERFIFSLGYKAEVVEEYLKAHYPTLNYVTIIEQQPLGTGGAIRLAITKAETENLVVANGDTLFKIKLKELAEQHAATQAACTIALKPMQDFDRYGVVEINDNHEVISFKEKQYYSKGLINGGLYLLNGRLFMQYPFPEKFSMEKDYLEAYYKDGNIYGCIQDGYFIDIGIPEDYQKAQEDLKQPVLDLSAITSEWTLFLDRDGVINDERVGKYVLHWNEFKFSKGVLEAFPVLARKFRRIIVISNQRGVSKKLMREEDLIDIHEKMKKEVEQAGGRIDRIYYCTDLEDTSFHRKPNPGMAWQVVNDFPDIDLSKSIMVGNKPSDMRFGRSAGMFTVFLTTTNPDQPFPHPDIDIRFDSLLQLAQALQS